MGKTIFQSERFDATPSELYAMFLDSKKHSAMTGGKAKISAKAGAKYSAWDGYIVGKNLELKKGSLIVQTWRSPDWKKSQPDSVLILNFLKDGKGTRLEMTHANVPDAEEKDLDQGWHDHYWEPMRAYLKSRG